MDLRKALRKRLDTRVGWPQRSQFRGARRDLAPRVVGGIESGDGDWTVGIYGRNITDARYDNARLNTGDYVSVMLSNDANEFGVRFSKEF
jgi:hypothetical protein